MSNQNEQDPPVRSMDPFRKASDPLSRETAAGDDDREVPVTVVRETYSGAAPDSVGVAESAAVAADGGRDADDQQARQQAREAGSGTTGHEVEPEANADMDLLGFDKNRK